METACLREYGTDMSAIASIAIALSLFSSAATAPKAVEEARTAPTAAELQELVEGGWPSFASRIRRQDGLAETPGSLIAVSQALCRVEMPETYECVSLVEYQLSNGAQRSSLLRHHVRRGNQGRLSDAILIRETPAPR